MVSLRISADYMESRPVINAGRSENIALRDTSLDVAKGIGIMLVVIGHSQIVMAEWKDVSRMIFSFHMPLFFFLSGMFIRSQHSLHRITTSRLDGLIKPYLSAALILGAIETLKHAISPSKFILAVVLGTGKQLFAVGGFPLLPLWFLPHLFAASISCFLILRCLKLARSSTRHPIHTMKRAAVALFAVAGLVAVLQHEPISDRIGAWWAIARFYWMQSTPFSLDLLPLTLGFMLAGAGWARLPRQQRVNGWALSISLGLFCLFHYFSNASLDLNQRRYDSPLICTVEAFLGIYITLCLSRLLSKHSACAPALAYLGQSSLFIMMFHVIIMTSLSEWLVDLHFNTLQLSLATISAGLLGPLLLREFTIKNLFLSHTLLPLKRVNRP
ncbi:MAG: acyltransferase family protein [Cyanobium sp. ELA712]